MNEMKLRVWWIRNPPNEPEYYPVRTVEEAKELIRQLTEDDLSDPCVESNVSGLEIFEDGQWIEYYDDDGNDITAILEEID